MTGPFGETIAGNTNPNNTVSDASWSYVGQHEKLIETSIALTPIQMGARIYIPTQGRFLSVDPIQGGTENNYVYPQNPITRFDLNGLFGYDYEYDVTEAGSPKEIMKKLVENFDPFPFTGNCSLKKGTDCSLSVMGYPSKVTITEVTSTSFAFKTREGHIVGANKTIKFSFTVNDNKTIMKVKATGKNNWWQKIPFTRRADRGAAQAFWKTFANALKGISLFQPVLATRKRSGVS